MPHTTGIALDGPDHHLTRLETVVIRDAFLPACFNGRVILKSQIHHSIISGVVVTGTNGLIPILSVHIAPHEAIQPCVQIGVADSLSSTAHWRPPERRRLILLRRAACRLVPA